MLQLNVQDTLLIIAVLVALWLIYPSNSRRRGGRRARVDPNPRYIEWTDYERNNSIYDTVQSPRDRGDISPTNQPNHIMNRWKCHYSQERDGGRAPCNEGVETPMWHGRDNMYIGDNSAMHLTSRFASE
jgi:hypothetical protein